MGLEFGLAYGTYISFRSPLSGLARGQKGDVLSIV